MRFSNPGLWQTQSFWLATSDVGGAAIPDPRGAGGPAQGGDPAPAPHALDAFTYDRMNRAIRLVSSGATHAKL